MTSAVTCRSTCKGLSVAGLGFCFVGLVFIVVRVCAVLGGRRAGVYFWISRPAGPFERGFRGVGRCGGEGLCSLWACCIPGSEICSLL